ncbi:heterokaryon incompatibility protein-domain-containing protein [Xylariales sp. AK1849]|nr:heterokaryon incompatibility protein-domain-containing protein [Xylariales sp. AK1849]
MPAPSTGNRLKLMKACRGCRRRKIKCNNEVPACLACLRLKLPCVYPPDRDSGTLVGAFVHPNETQTLGNELPAYSFRSPSLPEDTSPPRTHSPPCASLEYPEDQGTEASELFPPGFNSNESSAYGNASWYRPDISASSNASLATYPWAATLVTSHFHWPITAAQIRLLRLAPGEHDEPLRCALKAVDMRRIAASIEGRGSPYKYQALSYAWGSEPPTSDLFINREPAPVVPDQGFRESVRASLLSNSSGLFKIRPNLHQALTQLRSKKEGIWLWVDAICIDQTDEQEKNHQLSKMPSIYGNAWSVTIWIGDDYNSASQDLAMGFIPTILNLSLLDRLVATPVPNEETLKRWVAFASLLKRPWFNRRWVIQEIAYAKRAALRCGSNIINWLDFADAVELFFRKLDRIRALYDASELSKIEPDVLGHVESAGAQALIQASNGVLRKGSNGAVLDRMWSLETLVMKFNSFETTDPRDTVYALLSLASDINVETQEDSNRDDQRPGNKPFKPEYHRHPQDAFISFVQACVETTQSLDVICRHWAPTLEGRKMPSWIGTVDQAPFGPPSRFTGRINGDSLVGEPRQRIFNASKGTSAKATFPPFSNDGQDFEKAQREGGRGQDPATKKRKRNDELHLGMQAVGNGVSPTPGVNFSGTTNSAGDFSIPKLDRTTMAVADELYYPNSPAQLPQAANSRHLGKSPLRESEPVASLRYFSGSFCTKGLILRRIERVSPRVVDGTISDECLDILGWQHNANVNEIPEQLWRTLVADRGPDGRNAPTWYKRACAYSLLKTSPEGDLNTSKLIERETQPASVVEFLKRVQSVVWSRKFFETDMMSQQFAADGEDTAKLVGMGSRHIREGDLVCILFGCSVPVILRKLDETGNNLCSVKLMGECFAYGKMDGEAFAGLKPADVQSRLVSFEIW